MIQYYLNNDNKLISYSLSSLDIDSIINNNGWQFFSPTDLTTFSNEQFSVRSNYDTDKPIYLAFNHEGDYYADLGQTYNYVENIIYEKKDVFFEFKEKKNLVAIKFKLNDLIKPLRISLSYSLDGIVYETIDKYNLCCSSQQEVISDFIYCQDNVMTGNYFKGSPTIMLFFNHENRYKYYKLSFHSWAQNLQISSLQKFSTPIKISNMFLYDGDFTKNSMIKYFSNTTDNNITLNNVLNCELFNNAYLNENNSLILSDNSYAYLNSPVFYGDTMTISFLMKFNDLFSNVDTIFYKQNNVFSFSCFREKNCITFTALSDINYIGIQSFNGSYYLDDLYYFIDNNEILKYDFNLEQTNMIRLNKGQTISFCKYSDGFSSRSKCFYFQTNGFFNVAGNLMSLSGFNNTLNFDYQFERLFYNCNIVDASNLMLPQNIRYACYQSMFENCYNLVKAPYLPARNLTSFFCYQRMFYNCSNLEQLKINFINNDSYFVREWLYGVKQKGVLFKPDELNVENLGVPNNWEIQSVNNENIPVYSEINKIIMFEIKSKKDESWQGSTYFIYNFSIVQQQLLNVYNRYTFVFDNDYEKFYFNNVLNYQQNKKNFFNIERGKIYLGKNNQNNYISNAQLKNLSFYNYQVDLVDLNKENN